MTSCSRANGGSRCSRERRWWSWCCRSTCSATGCATRSTPSCDDARGQGPQGRVPVAPGHADRARRGVVRDRARRGARRGRGVGRGEIALAIAAEPSLLIADEPTTALDVSIQAQIIELLKRLARERGTAVMLITHDMGVIAETSHRVAVMYAGRIVEIGPVREVIRAPLHPYTAGLMGSIPKIHSGGIRGHLVQIEGAMPRLDAIPASCAFHPPS